MTPELHLWTVKDWGTRQGMSGGSFTIWASPRFMEAAKATKYDEERCQERARYIIKEAGFRTVLEPDVHRYLMFGEWGLQHFDVPGNACGLDMDMDRTDIPWHGITFGPHNVDTFQQQSALMSIWLFWAHGVEAQMKREEAPRMRSTSRW